jgi:hypothetical protein
VRYLDDEVLVPVEFLAEVLNRNRLSLGVGGYRRTRRRMSVERFNCMKS